MYESITYLIFLMMLLPGDHKYGSPVEKHFILKGTSCGVRNHLIVSVRFVSEGIHVHLPPQGGAGGSAVSQGVYMQAKGQIPPR